MGHFVAKTKEYFLEQAKKAHGDTYDYSLVDYVGALTNVIIICKEHGEFKQLPSNHYRGNGCPICAKKKTGRRGKDSIPSGYYGITFVPSRNKWRVVIFENGKRRRLGNFKELKDAISVQDEAIRRIYGDNKIDNLDGEEWKPIEETNNKFLISNKGRILNTDHLKRGIRQISHPSINPWGYVNAKLGAKSFLVHRLVAKYFIGDSKKQVNHKDGNRQNNFVENLEYVSNRTNVCHGFIVINGRKYIGAHIRKRDGWYTSTIKIKDKSIFLGAYKTPQEACDRYLRALLEYGLFEEHSQIVKMLSQND